MAKVAILGLDSMPPAYFFGRVFSKVCVSF